ncbi:hypothetical protein WMY93_032712 [Mugilogobius chulae]|uniref:Uncharacterized protein n=1 Tax=Mugilogobius chulae TaxID=88201 RepID=A0AAW0MUU7_9GOBI
MKRERESDVRCWHDAKGSQSRQAVGMCNVCGAGDWIGSGGVQIESYNEGKAEA